MKSMDIISWNVRGLGRSDKRLAVKKLVRRHKVEVLMLQETKISINVARIIHEVWGSQSCGWDWVPSGGGGLISIWDDKVISGEVVVKSRRLLAIKVRSLGDDFQWAMANVYGAK